MTKFITKRSTTRRKPLRTFNEIAEMLGLTACQLAPMMRVDGAPKPDMEIRSSSGKMLRYYEPITFKKWYENHTRSVTNGRID